MEPLSSNHVLTPLLGDEVLVSEISALGPIRPRGKQRLANHGVLSVLKAKAHPAILQTLSRSSALSLYLNIFGSVRLRILRRHPQPSQTHGK